MKSSVKIPAAILLIVIIALACKQKESETDKIPKANIETAEIKRVGMVIKLKPECIEEYKALHADSIPGVRDLLIKANMRNFSIFLHQLDDGNYYEFGYYEYHGNDFEADMATLAKEDRNIEWLRVCDPMQVPLDGYDGWAEMEQVYYNH
ncbi:MAG: L-rhamnose mutarotase [Bacteroidales bacterium]|nr:L-rhamnose mutarotase [Bacteroidales bacterium]